MRVLTWNLNGIRSAARRGLSDILSQLRPDVALFQEVRALPEQCDEAHDCSVLPNACWHSAVRPGYAGTGVATREKHRIIRPRHFSEDEEGRVVGVRLEESRPCECYSVYLPSGSSGEHRQAVKDAWLGHFAQWASTQLRRRTPVVLAGDLNIAPTERDLFYWRSNRKNSGFLPHEREWFAELLSAGWTDAVRETHPDRDGPYTWWSRRGKAYALDRGWRIDHVLLNRAAAKRLSGAEVHRDRCGSISDHCAVTVDLDL